MQKFAFIIFAALLIVACSKESGSNLETKNKTQEKVNTTNQAKEEKQKSQHTKESSREPHPMAIQSLREKNYTAGDLKVEKTLEDGLNFHRHVVSYVSEGLKIYGLLTVPKSPMPENGFPTVVFIHGYIPPKEYSTIKSYPTYQAALARAGFVTFKPDLRGHGNSEGEAVSAHYSEKYIIDTLYAINHLKKHAKVNPRKMVYWGHSNGGEIGLRVALISKDIKAYCFWAGVVGSYQDMLETYNHKISFLDLEERENPLVEKYKLPSQNPKFWNQIEPYEYLKELEAPIQLQHATGDESVPIELSISLKNELERLNKQVEFYKYQGDDHNISKNSNLAFQRTIKFYRKHLNIN
ncbi:MAG: alpha/beta fold hydrolase [Candidatus Moranbacteria bacterium]|nr:alpha/beta fold hydrolase [Candidatus Moranbacteria bacterium]